MNKVLFLVGLLVMACGGEGEKPGGKAELPLGCDVPEGHAHIDCSGACAGAPEFTPAACFDCESSIVVGMNWSDVVTVSGAPCPKDGSYFRFQVPPGRRVHFFTSGEGLAFRALDAGSDVISQDLHYENRASESVVVQVFGESAGDWVAAVPE